VAEWLLVEWAQDALEPVKYWLAYFTSQPPDLRRMVRIAKAPWRIELDYRELKEELGLDHYDGRHWLGWHHHVRLVNVAYAFLRSEQARLKKTAAVTLPLVRRCLQAVLIRLIGCCPWCCSQFKDSS
jgi:SRSO17 transposase